MMDLGVTRSHSRPHVSNDNPFSESAFKTLKYCPTFPERFGCVGRRVRCPSTPTKAPLSVMMRADRSYVLVARNWWPPGDPRVALGKSDAMRVRANRMCQTLLMRRRGLNLAQRLVVVFGFGVVVYLIGGWATTFNSMYGWVGYAPLSTGSATYGTTTPSMFEASSYGGGFHPWVRFVIWLVLIAVWTGASLVLLRSPSPDAMSDVPLQ